MSKTGKIYNLFISHARADRAWVRGYLIPALGLPADAILTPDDFQPGAALVAEFERGVSSSRYTLLVLSPAYLADDWAIFGEQLAAFASVSERRRHLIPLLLEPCELPLHLEFRVQLDCRTQASWDSEIARLRALLERPAPAREGIPCPYPGLVSYSEADAAHFYGRERIVQEILGRLHLHPFLTIIGPSGSGKSSLLQAGVLPALKQSNLFATKEWHTLILRPGPQPLHRLAAALSRYLPASPPEIRETLAADPTALARYLAEMNAMAPRAYTLLIIDQFEEVFAQCKDSEVRHAFLENLAHALPSLPPRCLVQ
jgi:AcrR family transcriptional regulator